MLDRWDLQPPAEGEEAVGGKWLLHMVTTTDVEAGEEVRPAPAVHTQLPKTQLQMYISWQPNVPGGCRVHRLTVVGGLHETGWHDAVHLGAAVPGLRGP